MNVHRMSHEAVVEHFKTKFGYSDGGFNQDETTFKKVDAPASSEAERLSHWVDSRRSPWDSVDFFSVDVGDAKSGAHPILVAEAQNETGEEGLVRFYTESGKTRIADLKTGDFHDPEWVIYK